MSVGAGDNKTLPEKARGRGHALHDAAGSAAGDRRATLYADGALLIELAVALEAAEESHQISVRERLAFANSTARAEARLVAVEAERDEALADSARGDNFKRQLRLATASLIEDRRAAEGRVVALEAENAELKGLKAGGDRVPRAEEEKT